MSWAVLHRASEESAVKAERALRLGKTSKALRHYADAAELEEQAFQSLEIRKSRTRGITATSAVSLWYKAGEYERARHLADLVLVDQTIPDFSRADLKLVVEAIKSRRFAEDTKAAVSTDDLYSAIGNALLVSLGDASRSERLAVLGLILATSTGAQNKSRIINRLYRFGLIEKGPYKMAARKFKVLRDQCMRFSVIVDGKAMPLLTWTEEGKYTTIFPQLVSSVSPTFGVGPYSKYRRVALAREVAKYVVGEDSILFLHENQLRAKTAELAALSSIA